MNLSMFATLVTMLQTGALALHKGAAMRTIMKVLAGVATAALWLGSVALVAPSTVGASSSAAATSGTSSHTVWLCHPGTTPDPCAGNLSYSVVTASGSAGVVHPRVASSPPIDCFYVYPTVSSEKSPNSDLTIQAAETGVAKDQVAPLSQDCRVFAPMYRQMTVPCLEALQGGGGVCSSTDGAAVLRSLNLAYSSVLSGFRSFLAQEPKGRHFVLMGHSQGAAMLIRLIRNVVDPNPALRDRLVSAILLGGNLTVPKGKTVGGAFKHIGLCTTATQLRCAIAYSSFYGQPPADSNFGIPGKGVSFMWLDTATSSSLQVACVAPNQLLGTPWTNPRFLGGSSIAPFVTYPKLYQARCQSSEGATFLPVTHPGSAGTNRPLVQETLGPTWGLHLDDPNLTLGNLVTVVARQSSALLKQR